MTIRLYANNAKTTLAAPINASQTSITVAAGTGTLFPSPAIGQSFKLTLASATVSTINEICMCTARTGDVLTVVRAQEGTSALPFILGDIAGNYDTAGTMDDLVQTEQLQNQYYQYGVATGTANALTASIPSNLTALSDGMYFTIKSAQANTGPATFNLTLGSTVTGVFPIVKGNGVTLSANDIPAAGYPMQINWSADTSSYVMANPATGILVSAVPPGAIVQFPAVNVPTGYLLCNGQLVSRVTYAYLWAFAQASGNLAASDAAWQVGQFSPGNGSSTFRLPQYGGYFLRSKDNGNGIDPGRAIGTAQGGQNVAHTHSTSVSVSDPGHAHGVYDPGHVHSYLQAGSPQAPGSGGSGVSYNNGALTGASVTGIGIYGNVTGVGVSVSNAAQGGTENRPINISVLTCIKY